MSVPDERRVFSVADFMRLYSISRARTYGEINAGRLVARKLGGRTFIARDDAESWVRALPPLRPVQVGEGA